MGWHEARRFLLVFTQRGGSTFLAHCLDSHPQIGCERGEPLLQHDIWRRRLPWETPETLLELVLGRPGYRVTVARVNYRHVREVGEAFLRGMDGIIHLHRENFVRVIVSAMINQRGLRPTHTYERLPAKQVTLDVEKLRAECERYVGNVRATRKWLGRMGPPLLLLGYDQIVGGEGNEARRIPETVGDRICGFLGVDPGPLRCELRRTNPEPLPELVANWDEVEATLRGTAFERWLD